MADLVAISDKLMVRGAASLSDKELLMLLLDDAPNVEESVEQMLSECNMSLFKVMGEDIARLRMIQGIGVKRAQRIAVVAELGRRLSRDSHSELKVITSSRDVVDYFKPKLNSLPHEECWVLYLASSNSVVEIQKLSVGGVTATVVDHRLIIKRALELLATQVIMVHNHPSGSVEPSREDIDLTQKVNSASALFDIKLLDHIIVGKHGEYSFLSAGRL